MASSNEVSKTVGSQETDALLGRDTSGHPIPAGASATNSSFGSFGFDDQLTRTNGAHRRHSSGEIYGYGSVRSGGAGGAHDKLSMTPEIHHGGLAGVSARTSPLLEDASGGKLGFYKNPHHLSESAFQTLTEGIVDQLARHRKINRSATVGAEMATASGEHLGHDLAPIEKERRVLYGALPYIATYGMQGRESVIRRVLSQASKRNLLEEIESPEQPRMTTLHLEEVDVDEIILTTPLALACVVSVTLSFLTGYNTSVMNAPAGVVFPDHSTFLWSLAVSAFAIGGPGGAIAGGLLANKRGRKGAAVINMWVFFLGGLMMTLAPNVYWLIPSRFVIGFAAGLASVLVPVYLGEMAPPTLRGTLGTLTQFAMVIGILFSNILAFPLATEANWRWLFAITPILSAVQLVLSPFLLESPRWLLGRDENSVEARVVIKKMRGYRFDEDIEAEVSNFLFASQKHKTQFGSAHSAGAMMELLRAKEIRVLVISAVMLQMAQQLCGINAVFYYSTTFFQGVIEKPLIGTTLVGAVNVIATYVALILMDNTERRTLIILSSGGMLVSTVIFTLSLLGYMSYSFVAMGAVMSYVAFFEIGLGPIPWLIVAEMFDSKYVATAMSLSCIVNWVCNFLVGLLFPYMQAGLGSWSFAPFALVLLLTLLFAYVYLPETHGRSVAEIQRLVGANEEEFMHMIETIQGIEDDGLVFGELDYSSDGDAGRSGAGKPTSTATTTTGKTASRGLGRYGGRSLGERDSSSERLSRDSFQEM